MTRLNKILLGSTVILLGLITGVTQYFYFHQDNTSKNLGSYFQSTRLEDEYGNEIEGTMMNHLKIAETNRLAGGLFNAQATGDGPDTTFWTVTNTNGASTTITNSEVDIRTSVTSGSSAQIASGGLARYMGSASNMFRAVIRMDAGITNNTRRWGAVNNTNPTEGYYFSLASSTFSVCTMLATTPSCINSGSFNGNGTASGGAYSLDTNYHTYEIYYTNKRAMFVVDSNPIHTFTATTGPNIGTEHLRPYISNINTGVGSVRHIYATVMTIARLGKTTSQPKSFFQQGTTAGVLLKVGPGSLHSINVSGVLNNSVVNIYDGTSTAGTLLYTTGTMFITNQSNNLPFVVPLDTDGGVPFVTGLFLAITGANSNALVKFE